MLKAWRKLHIAGAGDFAKELLWICTQIPENNRDWKVSGFLDDDVDAARVRLARAGIEYPVHGTIRDYVPRSEDVLTCAIGGPEAKLRVCEELRSRGAAFARVVHPTVLIGDRSVLGEGAIICPRAVVTVDAQVGHFVTINCFSSIGHDAVISDGCTISAHCDITGHATLERGAFLGSHASVLPHAHVGQFCTVGAGSVVVSRAPAFKTVFGVPARVFP